MTEPSPPGPQDANAAAASTTSGGMSREQVALVILSIGQDVAEACLADPLWIKRYRLGDTTALTAQVGGACAKRGLSSKDYTEALRNDPKLTSLQHSTVEMAVVEAEQALLASARVRRTVVIGGMVVFGVCLVLVLGRWYAAGVAEEKKAENARLHPTQPPVTPTRP